MDVYDLASGQTGKTSKSSENEARTSVGFFLHVLQVLAQRRKLPCQRDTAKGEFLVSSWARYVAGGRPANAS